MVQKVRELYALDKGGKLKYWSIRVEGDSFITQHGKLGGKLQERITPCKGKNKGKANETSNEQQAILEAESKYQHQIDKLYRPTKEEAISVGQVLPMLAKNYLDSGHRISYPCYTSPKLDGVRCIATFDRASNLVLTSRGGKEYDCPYHIYKALLQVYEDTGLNKFDGELYIHGMKLQDIISAVKKPNLNTAKLEFHVFDIPSDKVWEERLTDLGKLSQTISKSSPIAIVPNVFTENEDDAREWMNKHIANGFEGLILRNKKGLYEYNHRSADLQKWKDMQDMEVKVISVLRDLNDEAVFICETEDKVIFKCKIKGSHEERSFDSNTDKVNQWLNIKYQALTKDKAPQFPVGQYFRDCDKDGNPNE